jgi:hypothetical protein
VGNQKIRKLWIHGGLPKTGTSALQVFFQQNVKQLEDNCGLHYIQHGDSLRDAEKGKITSGNAFDLAMRMGEQTWDVRKDKDVDVLITYILASAYSDFLISSELFARVQPQNWQLFTDVLTEAQINTKYIFFARRQDQFLMSAYMQNVKRHGYSKPITEFVRKEYKRYSYLKYYSHTKMLESVFGEGNVFPLIYEAAPKCKTGIAGLMLKKITGRESDWFEPGTPINTSLTPGELKMMMMANKYNPRMHFSDVLVEGSIKAGKTTAFTTHNLIAPNLAQEVIDYFSEENAKFVSEYCDDTGFPTEIAQEYVDIESLSLNHSDFSDVIVRYLVNFDHRLAMIERNLSK